MKGSFPETSARKREAEAQPSIISPHLSRPSCWLPPSGGDAPLLDRVKPSAQTTFASPDTQAANFIANRFSPCTPAGRRGLDFGFRRGRVGSLAPPKALATLPGGLQRSQSFIRRASSTSPPPPTVPGVSSHLDWEELRQRLTHKHTRTLSPLPPDGKVRREALKHQPRHRQRLRRGKESRKPSAAQPRLADPYLTR